MVVGHSSAGRTHRSTDELSPMPTFHQVTAAIVTDPSRRQLTWTSSSRWWWFRSPTLDRAKAFYEKAGFHTWTSTIRQATLFALVQLTPPGSACSITIGTGLSTSEPGSYQGLHLVVTDIEARARRARRARKIHIGEPFHFGAEGQTPGVHPDRTRLRVITLQFSDPDGTRWLVQGSWSRQGVTNR